MFQKASASMSVSQAGYMSVVGKVAIDLARNKGKV
jgi:hypothetical protein